MVFCDCWVDGVLFLVGVIWCCDFNELYYGNMGICVGFMDGIGKYFVMMIWMEVKERDEEENVVLRLFWVGSDVFEIEVMIDVEVIIENEVMMGWIEINWFVEFGKMLK